MTLRANLLFGLIVLLGHAAASSGQEPTDEPKAQTIDITHGRPINEALEVLRHKYFLAISYEDPLYACTCDLADMSYTRKKAGPKIIVPKTRPFHFEYTELNGQPREEMYSLIRRMLAEYAAQGGEVFDVRERQTPKGPEWNIFPLKARDSSGSFVDQPNILGASIHIPKSRHTLGEFLEEMLQQLRTATGYDVKLGITEMRLEMGSAEFGAENVSARDWLAGLYDGAMAWQMLYDPEHGGRYFLSLVRVPQPPPALNPFPLPANRGPARRPGLNPPPVAAFHNMPTQSRMNIQSKLAQAGFYKGELNGKWTPEAADALKRFQAANDIPVTGYPDGATIQKLGLSSSSPQSH